MTAPAFLPNTAPYELNKFRLKTYTNGDFRSTLSPDGALFAIYGGPWHQNADNEYDDYRIILWEAEKGKRLETLDPFDLAHPVTDLAVSMDGSRLATFGSNLLQVWDLRNGNEEMRREIGGSRNKVTFLEDGSLLVLGGGGDVVCIDLETGTDIFKFNKHGKGSNFYALSPDKSLALLPYGDVQLWDTARGEVIDTFPTAGPRGPSGVDFSPKGDRFLVQGDDISVYETATRKKIFDIPFGAGMYTFVGFSPDGRVIGSYRNGNWAVYDAESGQQMANFAGVSRPFQDTLQTDQVHTPDGRWLVYGGRDLWEIPLPGD